MVVWKRDRKCSIKEATYWVTPQHPERAEACDILTLRWGVHCNSGSLTHRIWDAYDGKNVDTKWFYGVSAYSKQMSIEWMMTDARYWYIDMTKPGFEDGCRKMFSGRAMFGDIRLSWATPTKGMMSPSAGFKNRNISLSGGQQTQFHDSEGRHSQYCNYIKTTNATLSLSS